jgi:outer membrane protein assembly factor BamA
MAKVKHCFRAILVLTLWCSGACAQNYPVQYQFYKTDSVHFAGLSLTTSFGSRFEANTYISGLLPLLHTKGFITASLDSLRVDSTAAFVALYLGEPYTWSQVRTAEKDRMLLEEVRFPALKGTMDFATLQSWQKRILDHLEERGYPFGRSYLDSINLGQEGITALLAIETGPQYKIDSLRVVGDARVSSLFLEKYLQLPNGSLYSKSRLAAISKKLSELPYVEQEKPSDLTMMATGSVLNLYLKAKNSSQINALVGFLPNSDPLGVNRKMLLTADVNILLRNSLGSGETMGLTWQQLQRGSPRLNILYEQPYVFRSSFGARFSLDMYKLDSFFVNVNMNLGVNYHLGEKRTASIFLQRRSTIVSGINAAAVIRTKQLPQEADVSSLNLGAGYEYNNTDYRFNPRKGTQFTLSATAGTKKIKKNNLILELEDPADPSFKFDRLYDTVKQSAYQFRVNVTGAQFVQLGRQTTLKFAANAGVFQSPVVFRNELFQIGGNRLLRGFNEESQFVSQYGVGTVEFRLLTGLNSAFFGFVDGGWGRYPLEMVKAHTYISTGAGLSFQPKAGLINVTLAVGKRDDTEFNLRQSKIHIGFVSFF